MSRFIGVLAPAWMILIGALMIIPSGDGIVIECIKCGAMLTRLIGVVTIVVGGAAFALRGKG